MQVRDTDDKPISGLFAAGGTTGGLEGGGALGYVGGLIKAATMGLIAAEAASRT
jgi:fumarate reductase flavoprotein subunit